MTINLDTSTFPQRPAREMNSDEQRADRAHRISQANAKAALAAQARGMRYCPRCGSSRFADDHGPAVICDTCRQLEREPQGEHVRLFQPAPATMPGQLDMGDPCTFPGSFAYLDASADSALD